MMNLQPYKEEIFRRSAERLKKRRQLRKRALMLCIPLVLVLTVALAIPKQGAKELAQDAPMEMEKPEASVNESIAENDYATGSIFCSYYRAKITIDGQTVTVTDKIKVDKLFNIVGFNRVAYGGSPVVPESSQEVTADQQPASDGAVDRQIITFYTADGSYHQYWVDGEQLERIRKVLK